MRKSLLLLFVVVCLCNVLKTQVIINKYAAVLAYEPCANALTVDTATDFNVGDTVLMIQMKGATIDSSNTANFGSVINYGDAGHYEYNVVAAKNGNNLSLKYNIVRTYNIASGKVQLVRVPYYQNYTVSQLHTCSPWNGTKGGVFAIIVANVLTQNAKIDVTGMGFAGGDILLSTTLTCNATDYFYDASGNLGAHKGEGIAPISDSKIYGKGALSCGGGGGNAHNGGGAGGGNGGVGGIGGNQYDLTGCATQPIIPDVGGRGGLALTNSPSENRLFLGGGGGAGHGNDLGEKPGAAGGGIVLINANSIVINADSIIANGGDAIECATPSPGCQFDGTGGGGGGGSVFVNANSFTGNLKVAAKGGKGANTFVPNTTPVGPGGGGGGGVIIYSQSSVPLLSTNITTGGLNGILPQSGSVSWGAEPGQNGTVLTNFSLDFPTILYSNVDVTADFNFSAVNCFTFNFADQSSSTAGNINSWNWNFSNNSVSTQQNVTHTFPDYGIYDVTLTVTNINGCLASVTKQINIPYTHFADAGPDLSACANNSLPLHATGGVNYSWSPTGGLSNPNIANPVANITNAITYVVAVTNDNGCVDKDSVFLSISPAPTVLISSDGNNVNCDNKSMQLHANGAQKYNWSPGNLCDDSTSQSPTVSPTATTTFTLVGTDPNGCTGTDTFTVYQYLGNSKVFMPNAFSPNGDGKNDDIYPIVLCDFSLDKYQIFNRWGQLIFYTNKLGKGWDGSYNKKPADEGTYFYYIAGRKNNGDPISLKGDISLIR